MSVSDEVAISTGRGPGQPHEENQMTTYSKLKDGSWGVRGSVAEVVAGASVTVNKKSGESKTETVGRVLWTDGELALATIAASSSSKSYSPSRKTRACKTGGNCSSFGSGRSCGAHDCDGW